MKAILFFLLAGLGMSFGQDQRVFGRSDEVSLTGKILRITVGEDDLVNGESFKFWERILERAKKEEAKGIIFDLDTPGGLAFPTEELMTEIANVGIPTVAFVNPKAISAGSFIAISTDEIYMTPGSKIGSSAIVSGSGMEIGKEMRAKLESYFGAQVRYIAKQKGYRPEVIEAMMFLSEEERTIGDVVVKPGGLLNLNSSEATKMLDDGPLLAAGEVKTLEELLKIKGWDQDEVVTAEPTGFEKLAWWIASYSGILIMIGLGGGYFELKTPGFGVGGIVCLSAFGFFFFGNYMAGNLANYELVALFILGVVLIAAELFLIPGTGVTGIAGVLCLLGALLLGTVDKIDWNDWKVGDFSGSLLDLLRGPAFTLGTGLLGGSLLVLLLMRFLPSTPLFRAFVSKQELAGGASLADQAAAVGSDDRTGMTGEALTDLRPAGKVALSGEELDVIADGAFIRKGSRIRVLRQDGMKIVVSAIESVCS